MKLCIPNYEIIPIYESHCLTKSEVQPSIKFVVSQLFRMDGFFAFSATSSMLAPRLAGGPLNSFGHGGVQSGISELPSQGQRPNGLQRPLTTS